MMLYSAFAIFLLAAGAAGNFLKECEFISFSLGDNDKDPFLHYSCPLSQAPYLWCSKLKLNDCIVNNFGNLEVREKGGFGASCDKCTYDEKLGKLECWCRNTNGGVHWNSINLADFVWLSGSKLGCFGMKTESSCSTGHARIKSDA
ncbi:hypothetical protein CCHR01_12301 [Colletotrichum chrysophilum]|uniref:Cyanovirin-N domain-containing protein n=1 Tax=Colletotrichum chrysophilum TaxID=1836956 RepID=A0AAD9ACG8_9PEZI|nr:hypothetical protein CCHR01_12301 [Colletotrichum chrysophilum]